MNKDDFINELKESLKDGNTRVKSNEKWVCVIDCDGEWDDGLQYYPDIDG